MSLPSELLKLFDVNNSWGIQESTLWAGDAFFPKKIFEGVWRGCGDKNLQICENQKDKKVPFENRLSKILACFLLLLFSMLANSIILVK